MSTPQKEFLSKWAPLLFSILVNLALVAYSYGKMEQRLVPIEQHVMSDTTEKAMSIFVTRQEFVQRSEMQDRELKDISAKLDRLIEMHMKRD